MERCSKCNEAYDAAVGTHVCATRGRAASVGPVGPGTLIGSYRCLELLGEGTIGRVYLAEHVTLGRKVALKVLRSEWAENRKVMQRFFSEARSVNRIAHENIVQITDFIQEGTPACVMELLEGRTLEEALAEQPRLPVPRLLGIARQIAEGLRAAHAAGIVHRDLKPANVFLVDRDGADFVKLLDFGVAKLSRPGESAVSTETAAGTLVGTPQYMAPEQTLGAKVDLRADVYAYGLLLYEALSGAPPFSGQSLGEMLRQHREDPVPRLQDAPAELDALVQACVAKNPDHRPSSMAEIIAVLDRIARPARMRRWWGLAAVAGGLVAGAGLWLAAQRTPEPTPVRFVTPDPRPAAPTPPPAPAKKVTLRFESEPPGAQVHRLSTGEVLGKTPCAVRTARTSDPERFEVRLEGHVTDVQTVRAESDMLLRVRLVPVEPEVAPAAKAPRRKPRKARRTTRRPPEEIREAEIRNPFE